MKVLFLFIYATNLALSSYGFGWNGFISSKLHPYGSKYKLAMKDTSSTDAPLLVIFNDVNMRLHDNPCLEYAEKRKSANKGTKIIPVFLEESLSRSSQFQSKLTETLHVEQPIITSQQLLSDVISANKNSEIVICVSLPDSDSQHSAHKPIMLSDHLSSNLFGDLLSDFKTKDSWEMDYSLFNSPLRRANDPLGKGITTITQQLFGTKPPSTNDRYIVPQPILQYPSLQRIPGRTVTANAGPKTGEDIALELIRKYLQEGETTFSQRFGELYVEQSKSASTKYAGQGTCYQAMQRLHYADAFFSGEVITGLLSPYLSSGQVSPRLLYHARRALSNNPLSLQRPLYCPLREMAVQHDWHLLLAHSITNKQHSSDKVKQRFYFGGTGHLLRSVETQPQPNSSTANDITLICIHGFGGSGDQFQDLAFSLQSLGIAEKINIQGICEDSIGFGRSAKPLLSYDQYLWRDQALNVIDNLNSKPEFVGGSKKVMVTGNSIGGYTAAMVAAALGSERCAGLILFNPSGVVLNTSVVPQEVINEELPRFPVYKGPSATFLQAFGVGIIATLQPRILSLCQWLYPNQPQRVLDTKLAKYILRDSRDPGAANILGSGGKLPPPVSLNALFQQFGGPVLLVQGAKDPLNDAVSRAKLIASINKEKHQVSVKLLPLGHCPMDEDPEACAQVVMDWIRDKSLVKRSLI